MKKLNILALVASVAIAAPAFAQTPADVKNFRLNTPVTVSEPAAPVVVLETKAPVKKKSTKKSSTATKSVKAKTDEVKKDLTDKKDEVKKDETKKDEKK